MSQRVALVFGIAAIIAGLIALISGWWVFWLIAAACLFIVGGWAFEKYIYIMVPEFYIAVIFNRETKAFSRFLHPGRHWLNPVYKVESTFKYASRSAKATTSGARTADGIPVSVSWNAVFDIDIDEIMSGLERKMARALPMAAEGMVSNHGNNVLQQLLGKKTVKDLCQEGIQEQLENEFKEALADRVSIFGMKVARVMVLSIDLPHEVQVSIEAAHKREMIAESEARALKLLQEVVHGFSDTDMERLSDLEKVRVAGENGGGLAYLLASISKALK